MKRLIIAIDCDDVLVPSTKQIVDLYNQQFGTAVRLEDAHSSNNPAWQTEKDTARERIHNIQLTEGYGKTAPFEDAVSTCRWLSESHELHLVTARPEKLMPVTQKMLEQYFDGVFKEIEHVGLDGHKGEICKNLKADVLIDDNYKHLVAAGQCQVSNLIWFGDYPWQTEVAGDLPIVRCKDWADVEKEINRIAGV